MRPRCSVSARYRLHASWSPDGRWIACPGVGGHDESYFYIINSQTGEYQKLTTTWRCATRAIWDLNQARLLIQALSDDFRQMLFVWENQQLREIALPPDVRNAEGCIDLWPDGRVRLNSFLIDPTGQRPLEMLPPAGTRAVSQHRSNRNTWQLTTMDFSPASAERQLVLTNTDFNVVFPIAKMAGQSWQRDFDNRTELAMMQSR